MTFENTSLACQVVDTKHYTTLNTTKLNTTLHACQVVDLVCTLAWRWVSVRRVAANKLLRLQAIF